MSLSSSIPLVIDGSVMEGGGQIIRIALTMSAIKKIPVKITNIRAGRSKPGLMAQHLKGLELVRDITNANVKGAHLESTEIEFHPRDLNGGTYKAFVKTAGSISLLLQVSLPCAICANITSELELFGGTNAEMAPQIDYTTEVFRPLLEKFGATFDFDLIKRGYFPKGGGQVIVQVKPVKVLNGVNLTEQGEITNIFGWSFVSGTLPIKLANDIANSASEALDCVFNKANIERYKEDRNMAPDNCSGIILVAETSTGCVLGGSALGKRGESSEETGKRAAEELLKAIKAGACVDEHCQDQMIILMALAAGNSKVKTGEITLHTKTAIFVVEQFSDNIKFNIIPSGVSNIIECIKI